MFTLPCQTSPTPSLNAARPAPILHNESCWDEQESFINDAHVEQEKALAALRLRLQGLCGELKQLIGTSDPHWHRFGLNMPAETEKPAVCTDD